MDKKSITHDSLDKKIAENQARVKDIEKQLEIIHKKIQVSEGNKNRLGEEEKNLMAQKTPRRNKRLESALLFVSRDKDELEKKLSSLRLEKSRLEDELTKLKPIEQVDSGEKANDSNELTANIVRLNQLVLTFPEFNGRNMQYINQCLSTVGKAIHDVYLSLPSVQAKQLFENVEKSFNAAVRAASSHFDKSSSSFNVLISNLKKTVSQLVVSLSNAAYKQKYQEIKHNINGEVEMQDLTPTNQNQNKI